MNDSRTAAIFIHGLFSSPATWSAVDSLLEQDPDLRGLAVLHFSYQSPVMRLNPVRRIPNFNDIADSLAVFFEVETTQYDSIALISHSQGGLVAQRFLARMLADSRGYELAKIRRIVMFACPNSGSELGLTIRRGLRFWKHPQEQELRPINESITATQRTIVHSVISAKQITETTCPIRMFAYAGDSDNIVTPSSAKSVFRDVGVIPGDHSSIIRPDSLSHRSYTTLKWNLQAVLNPDRGEQDRRPSSTTTQFDQAQPAPPTTVKYDSRGDADAWRTWTYTAERGVRPEKFPVGDRGVLAIQSKLQESVGLNKSLPMTSGTIEFEYRVADSGGSRGHMYFAVIPMQETGPGRAGLIEVGTNVQGDHRNPRSPFRQRSFIPLAHYADGEWHAMRIQFDFSSLAEAFYAIFGPRINEGLEERGDGILQIRNVVAWS
ncbi:alpha/beta hydrolase [Lentzea tibetensis]|uniref:Alpha/beta hydrolase n=1 Tax=Lentzea tibetensis TaxID=2591470 RepID=A0A563EQW3_9PSEU|nr:alpha/beta fold hydrolase [Lentzea tibetensis]TWP50044.1 alpha/beta hydrolase [Lentzea tibetensis]